MAGTARIVHDDRARDASNEPGAGGRVVGKIDSDETGDDVE